MNKEQEEMWERLKYVEQEPDEESIADIIKRINKLAYNIKKINEKQKETANSIAVTSKKFQKLIKKYGKTKYETK